LLGSTTMTVSATIPAASKTRLPKKARRCSRGEFLKFSSTWI
jgi:hypothetical protein